MLRLFERVTDEARAPPSSGTGGILFNLPCSGSLNCVVIGVKGIAATGTHATKQLFEPPEKPMHSTTPIQCSVGLENIWPEKRRWTGAAHRCPWPIRPAGVFDLDALAGI